MQESPHLHYTLKDIKCITSLPLLKFLESHATSQHNHLPSIESYNTTIYGQVSTLLFMKLISTLKLQ